MGEEDFARFRYVQEMGATYLAVALFENALVGAMNMCDRVKVRRRLGEDADRWEHFQQKRNDLRASTLGSLITVLERHSIAPSDLNYLRWIKNKRDHFIHRWFHDWGWPGEMDPESCLTFTRRLLALQLWLGRAGRNIWPIFERAGFVELSHFDDGILITNMGIFDLIEPVNGSGSGPAEGS